MYVYNLAFQIHILLQQLSTLKMLMHMATVYKNPPYSLAQIRKGSREFHGTQIRFYSSVSMCYRRKKFLRHHNIIIPFRTNILQLFFRSNKISNVER